MIPKPPPRAPRVDQQTLREFRAKLSVERPQTGPPQTSKRVQQIRIPSHPCGPSTLKSPIFGATTSKTHFVQNATPQPAICRRFACEIRSFRLPYFTKKTGLNRPFCELVAPGRPAGRPAGRASTICCAFQSGHATRVQKNPAIRVTGPDFGEVWAAPAEAPSWAPKTGHCQAIRAKNWLRGRRADLSRFF